MPMHKLSDSTIRHAKCPSGVKGKDFHDGGGLFLRVKTTGTKSWMFQWSCWKEVGKRPKMGLGAYPLLSLAKARIRAQNCRVMVADQIDPRGNKAVVVKAETFEDALHAAFEKKKPNLKGGGSAGRWMSGPETHVLPVIGKKPINLVTIEDLVGVLKPIWQQELGRKTLPKIVATINNARTRDPALLSQFPDLSQSLKDRLPDPKRSKRNHPALPWELASDVWMMLGDQVNERALRFYLLNMPRVANVTHARWGEIDFDAKVWDIPAENTKNAQPFAAPLSKQSLSILEAEKARLNGEPDDAAFVFPNPESFRKGIVSENAFTNWMKAQKLPSTDERLAVAHGLRASFGTWTQKNEICDEGMADRCIQHTVLGESARAYLRDDLREPRRKIMQSWADFVTSGEKTALEAAQKASDARDRLEEVVETKGRTRREVEEWARNSNLDHVEGLEEEAHRLQDETLIREAH